VNIEAGARDAPSAMEDRRRRRSESKEAVINTPPSMSQGAALSF
jgi:hypothetical protein